MLETNKIYQGEALEVLKTFPSETIDCVMTSPPYWGLRDYNVDNQLGQEETFTEYIEIAEKRINAELNNQATKLFT